MNNFSCILSFLIPYPDMPNILEPYIWYNRYFWNEETLNWELII